jgi:hypothetical protein
VSEAPPHPTGDSGGAGALLLRLLAGLLVVLAGACAALFVPFILLIAATAAPGELAPEIAPWMIYLWCLFAFVGSTGMVIAGAGAMARPRLRRILALVGVAAAIFLSFPPFVPVPA